MFSSVNLLEASGAEAVLESFLSKSRILESDVDDKYDMEFEYHRLVNVVTRVSGMIEELFAGGTWRYSDYYTLLMSNTPEHFFDILKLGMGDHFKNSYIADMNLDELNSSRYALLKDKNMHGLIQECEELEESCKMLLTFSLLLGKNS